MLFAVAVALLLCLAHAHPQPVANPLQGNGCSCVGLECGCCVHVSWSEIGVNDEACLNITYNPSQLSISLTLDLEDLKTRHNITVLNETVSARNPDVCVGVPYLKKLASICLLFQNVSYGTHHLTGCAFIEAKLVGIDLGKFKLGCFDIKTPFAALPAAAGIVAAHAALHSDPAAVMPPAPAAAVPPPPPPLHKKIPIHQ